MMLRYSLDQPALAGRVEAAVNAVLDEGLRTPDIYTEDTVKVGTQEMGDAVMAAIKRGLWDEVTGSLPAQERSEICARSGGHTNDQD